MVLTTIDGSYRMPRRAPNASFVGADRPYLADGRRVYAAGPAGLGVGQNNLSAPEPVTVTPSYPGDPAAALKPVQGLQQRSLSTWTTGGVYKATPRDTFDAALQPSAMQRSIYRTGGFDVPYDMGASRGQAINPLANFAAPGVANPTTFGSSMAYTDWPAYVPG
jgi:hypothetical protein